MTSTRVHASGNYVLSSRIVYAALIAFLASIGFNVVGIANQVSRVHVTNPIVQTENGVSRLPVALRKVAMEVVDSDRYGMVDDNDWASVIPLGHGFVYYGDGNGTVDAETGGYYAVSMYHQMHCLNSFRKMFNHHNTSRGEHDDAHALHCLTYLRQMVLCAADITLEPAFAAINVDGRETEAAYGTGVTHMCRDWVQVRELVEENYQTWKAIEKTDHVAVTEMSAVAE